jgi:type II secretory pathway pseudopilin PulG
MPRSATHRPGERGFSLLELLLALLVAVEILIAAAIAFDLHNKMAVVQTQITEMQQSLRVAQFDVARLVRAAGRGSLPGDLRPDYWDDFDPLGGADANLQGLAIEVRNNVTGDAQHVARGDNGSPQAIGGTDILTLRGCFANPLYQARPETLVLVDDGSGGGPDTGTLQLDSVSVAGIRQPLGPLCDELGAAGTDTLIIGSPESRQRYGLAQVTGHDCPAPGSPEPTSVTLSLTMANDSPLHQVDPDLGVRVFPPRLAAALVCLVEEYRYFVREVYEVEGDAGTPLRPRLTRARFQPGTELPFANATDFVLDLADGIFDLQVAVGLDSDYPSTSSSTPGSFGDDVDDIGVDDEIFEAAVGSADRDQDDWLYNDPDDNPEDLQYREHAFTGRAGLPVQPYFLRITTLARTLQGDGSYTAPDFDTTSGSDLVEDHDYDAGPSPFKVGDNLRHRRRALTTVIDLRNL